jgi:spiro-SPASM protein
MLNIVEKGTKKNLKACLRAYNCQRVSGSFYPVYYGIEVTRHCNFSCVMCPNPRISPKSKGHMDIGLFRRIIDQVSPFAEIIKLHWIGEPLMHPQITEMISYARSTTNNKLFLSTNASLLNGKLAKEIRTSGLDKIIISLDSTHQNSYGKIKKKGNFLKVRKNVEDFINDVQTYGGPNCEIKMIKMPENEDEVDYFRKKWDKFDCVVVSIMWLCTWAGQIPELNRIPRYLCPYDPSTRQACSDLWFKLQVDWRGKVALCCFDWSGSVEIGDLSIMSLTDVWQSKRIKIERQKHLECNYSGICKSCNEWAKVEEYEFWYDDEILKEDPSLIWYSKAIPNSNT